MTGLDPSKSVSISFDGETSSTSEKNYKEYFGYIDSCGWIKTDGVYKCSGEMRSSHLTEFTYFEAFTESKWKYDWLYASPIIWVILIAWGYLLLTLFVGCLCWSRDKKHP